MDNKVVLCPTCRGLGKIQKVGAPWSDKSEPTELCYTCRGYRLVTESIVYFPYVSDFVVDINLK